MTVNRVPAQPGANIACRTCGTTAPTSQARVTGAWSMLAGVPVWDCGRCARDHLHEIEAGVNRGTW